MKPRRCHWLSRKKSDSLAVLNRVLWTRLIYWLVRFRKAPGDSQRPFSVSFRILNASRTGSVSVNAPPAGLSSSALLPPEARTVEEHEEERQVWLDPVMEILSGIIEEINSGSLLRSHPHTGVAPDDGTLKAILDHMKAEAGGWGKLRKRADRLKEAAIEQADRRKAIMRRAAERGVPYCPGTARNTCDEGWGCRRCQAISDLRTIDSLCINATRITRHYLRRKHYRGVGPTQTALDYAALKSHYGMLGTTGIPRCAVAYNRAPEIILHLMRGAHHVVQKTLEKYAINAADPIDIRRDVEIAWIRYWADVLPVALLVDRHQWFDRAQEGRIAADSAASLAALVYSGINLNSNTSRRIRSKMERDREASRRSRDSELLFALAFEVGPELQRGVGDESGSFLNRVLQELDEPYETPMDSLDTMPPEKWEDATGAWEPYSDWEKSDSIRWAIRSTQFSARQRELLALICSDVAAYQEPDRQDLARRMGVKLTTINKMYERMRGKISVTRATE